MEKNRTAWSKLCGAVLWECRKRYCALRYPAVIYLAVLLVICALPQELCRFLDEKANILVVLINLGAAVTMIFGFAILPYSTMSYPYGREEYRKEQLSDVALPARLFARTLANVLQCLLLLAVAYATEWGMEKFADAGHSYFTFSLSRGLWESLLLHGLLNPLVYLAVFLRRYLRHQNCCYVSSYIIALLITDIAVTNLDSNLESLTRTHPALWSGVCAALWALMVLLAAGFSFWLCCRTEKQLYSKQT